MAEASIVIPVFNRAHLVSRAIDSALAQTQPCEVVVVDHGSTDDIDRVIKPYADLITYVRRERDCGPVAAWIDGIEHATGRYVHITYDDDWIQPSFMQRCIDAFEPDVGFVYSRATLHLGIGGPEEASVIHPAGKHPMAKIVRHLLSEPLALSPGCAVFRTSDALDCLLDEVPGATGDFGPQSGVGEDLLLFLLVSLRYSSYVHIDERLADFLAHSESITIGAMSTGRTKALAAAYDTAKSYYHRQPGAMPPMSKGAQVIQRLAWIAGSGALDQYATKFRRHAIERVQSLVRRSW